MCCASALRGTTSLPAAVSARAAEPNRFLEWLESGRLLVQLVGLTTLIMASVPMPSPSCASLESSLFNVKCGCLSWSRGCRCPRRIKRNLPVSPISPSAVTDPLLLSGCMPSHARRGWCAKRGMWGAPGAQTGSTQARGLLLLGRGGIQTPPASCGRNGTVASVRGRSHLRLGARSGNPAVSRGPGSQNFNVFS
jgi:hypothetical protein